MMRPTTTPMIPICVLAVKYPQETISTIVKTVLLAVKNNNTRYEKQIKQAIRQFIRIDGSRDSSKAIVLRFQTLCDATTRSIRYRPQLALAVFQSWVEINHDIRWSVEQALAQASVTTLPIRATLPLEQTPGTLTVVIKQLTEILADHDPDQIELMMICVSGQLPVEYESELPPTESPEIPVNPAATELSSWADPAPSAAISADEDESQSAIRINLGTGAMMIWDDIVARISVIPAHDSAWDEEHIEHFIDHLLTQAQNKRTERTAPIRHINQLITSIQADYADILTFLGIDTTLCTWRADDLALDSLEQTTAQIHQLISLLQTHLQTSQRPITSVIERKQRESDLDQIERQIETTHTELQQRFEQARNRSPEGNNPLPAALCLEETAGVPMSAPSEPQPAPPLPLHDPAAAAPVSNHSETAASVSQPEFAQHQNGFAASVIPIPNQVREEAPTNPPGPAPAPDHQPEQSELDEALLSEIGPASTTTPLDQLEEIDLDEPSFSHPRQALADQFEEIDPEEALFTFTAPANRSWSDPIVPEPLAPSETLAGTEPPEGMIAQIAWQLRHGQVNDQTRAYATLIWQLLLSQQYGLAYHLTRLREHQRQPVPLPAALVRAIALASNICDDIGDSASLLKHDYSLFPPIGDHQAANALLVATATMQPALLAPSSGAPTMLSSIPQQSQLPHFHHYCQVIVEYGQHMQPLDMRALRFVNNRTVWNNELNSLCRQIREWRSDASNKTNKYAPASAVWRRWLRHSGPLKQLLDQISEPDGKQITPVRRLIEQLNDQDSLRDLVNSTDRDELGRNGGDDIHGLSFNQLWLHTKEAIDLARRWVRLQEQQPSGRNNFFQERTARLQRETRELYPQVRDELATFAAQHEPMPLELEVALTYCRHALEQIQDLLAQPDNAPTNEQPPHLLLHAVLLRSSHISTSDTWEPLASDAQLETALLEIAENLGQSWDIAFETWCEQRDHEQTRRVLEVVRFQSQYADQHSLLQARRDRQLKECQSELGQIIDETRGRVESAVAYGLLREEERNGFLSRLQQIAHDQHTLLQFGPAHTRLDRIREELDNVRSEKIASVRKRLASFQITAEHPAYTRISDVLDKGDALVADEYIDMVQRNEPLPESQGSAEPKRTRFGEFYPDFIREGSREFEQNSNQSRDSIIQYLEQRTHGRTWTRPALPLFEQRNLPGPDAATAVRAIKAWFNAKKARKLDTALAAEIFNNLGFQVLELTQEESGRITRFHLNTRLVRQLCPVRQYGSDAQGHYQLLCTWERPTETELISVIKGQPHNFPTVVCYFNRMTEARWKGLARLCREQHITCLLLDELLLLYLCTLPSPRLSHLFDCALPFTYLDPYTTTASVVPPEIFYGRVEQACLGSMQATKVVHPPSIRLDTFLANLFYPRGRGDQMASLKYNTPRTGRYNTSKPGRGRFLLPPIATTCLTSSLFGKESAAMAETFGNLLWSYRMGKHVDLAALAQASGVGSARLQLWESGQALPRAEVVLRDVCAALELTLAQRETLLAAWRRGRDQAAPAGAAAPDEPPPLHPPVDLPDLTLLANNLIGQGAAYNRLWALYEQVAAGEPGRLALICGQPGHSRAALAHALADDAQAQGAAALRLRFWPLMRADEQTRAAVWQEDVLVPPEALALEQRVAQDWPAAARLAGWGWVRLVAQAAALLEQTPTPRLLQQPDSPDALRALLWRLAADRPVVLVLDGLEQAPEPWPDLLADLAADQQRGLGLLTLVTLAAPAPLDTLSIGALLQERVRVLLPHTRRLLDRSLAQALWLGPVSPAEVAAFTGLSAELAGRLHTLSEGIPALVESLWFDWQDTGLVEPDGRGGWLISDPSDLWLTSDPAGLATELLAAHLPPDAPLDHAAAMRVLGCAALEGPSFTAQAVAEALELPVDAVLDLLDDALLDSADQTGLVREVGFVELPGRSLAEQPSVYRFAAPHLWLLWARHGLAAAERPALLRALAEALERVYHPHPDWVGDRLIGLFEAGGRPERAEPYRAKRVIDPMVTQWLLARLESRQREGRLDGFDQRQLFDLRLELSAALFTFGQHAPGLAVAEAALEQAQSLGERRLLAQAAYAVGAQAISTGQVELAEQRLGQVLALREQVLPPEHPDIAAALDYLGTLARMRGMPEQAVAPLERALRLRERALGPIHPATATSLQNLGAALVEQGRAEQALPLLERALAIRSRLHGEPIPEAETFQYLGSAYRDLGRLEQARPLFERTLALHEQALGSNHPLIAGDLHNLASLYHAQGALEQARPLYERALALSEQIHGPEHVNTAQVLNNLGALLQAQGQPLAAQGLFVRALRIFLQHLPPDHPALLGTRQWLRALQAELVLGAAPPASGGEAQIALLRQQARDAVARAGTAAAERSALATALEARARWAEQGEPDGSPYRALAAELRALIAQLGARPDDPDQIG